MFKITATLHGNHSGGENFEKACADNRSDYNRDIQRTRPECGPIDLIVDAANARSKQILKLIKNR